MVQPKNMYNAICRFDIAGRHIRILRITKILISIHDLSVSGILYTAGISVAYTHRHLVTTVVSEISLSGKRTHCCRIYLSDIIQSVLSFHDIHSDKIFPHSRFHLRKFRYLIHPLIIVKIIVHSFHTLGDGKIRRSKKGHFFIGQDIFPFSQFDDFYQVFE